MATESIQLFHQPDLFTLPGNKIPHWIQQFYYRLALSVNEKGIIQGTRTIANALNISQSTTMELIQWLKRLKLLVELESGRGRRPTTYQLRRFFVKKFSRRNFVNGNPYKVYKKNLKTNTYGDGPRFRRYSMKHLREAVTRVKTLSEDQQLIITKLIGKLVWKAKLQKHQIKALWEWLTNVLPYYKKLKLTGRKLAMWFISKVQRFASPSTARWASEQAEEASRQQIQWEALEAPSKEQAQLELNALSKAEQYQQSVLAWATARECLYGQLMAVGWSCKNSDD